MTLEARGLSRRFGGLLAVADVSLRLRPGVPHAVIGPNGAGKSTLINLLGGAIRADSGAILLNGVRVGAGSMVGAGAVVMEGMQIPPGSLVVGVPAKVVRALDAAQQAQIVANAARYVSLKEVHRTGGIVRHSGAVATRMGATGAG